MSELDASNPRAKAGALHLIGLNAALLLALVASFLCIITTAGDRRLLLVYAGGFAVASLLLLALLWRRLGPIARGFSVLIALFDLAALAQAAPLVRW